ncbi:MAG: hypothetical protein H6819_10375 [Phycisphaerales bacterium]|nr:hypothetical protein [Phycisphaerales bacterium]MCB9855967.1 hypothetical protein [Phycisphaerales bacterium]
MTGMPGNLNRREFTSRLFECAGLVAIAVSFALANGLAFGVSNHYQYLLHGLHALNRDFLAGDWFTCTTSAHHSAFVPLMKLFAAIGPMPLMFALANAAAASVVIFCLHGLARRWFDRPLVVTALTAFFMIAIPLPYVGMTSLVGMIFQPSTIGAVGLFAGLTLLCLGRVRNAGVVLGAASIFHINYMVWGVLISGAVVVLNYRALKTRGALWLLTPLAMAVLYHTPFIAESRTEEQLLAAKSAQWILHDLYMPYHSRPHTWKIDAFIQFASLMLAGGVALAVAAPRSVNRMTHSVAGVLVGIIVTGMLLTTIWQVDLVALLFPYRLIPFLIVTALLLVAGAIVRATLSTSIAPANCAVILVMTGAALFVAGVENYGLVTCGTIVSVAVSGRMALDTRANLARLVAVQTAILTALICLGIGRLQASIALAALIGAFASRIQLLHSLRQIERHFGSIRDSALAMACVAFALGFVWRVGTQRKDRLGPPPSPSEAALYHWCRSTPIGTQFVVPPDLAGFRLNAGRGIVIDWKCMPILPADTLTWYERLVDVSGVRFTSLEQCLAGYRAMDVERARSLAKDYRAEYLVTRTADHPNRLVELPIAFSTPDWRVYRIVGAAVEQLATDSVRDR